MEFCQRKPRSNNIISVYFVGEFLSFEAAAGSEDERVGEARKGFQAGEARDADAQHWIHVDWRESYRREK